MPTPTAFWTRTHLPCFALDRARSGEPNYLGLNSTPTTTEDDGFATTSVSATNNASAGLVSSYAAINAQARLDRDGAE